MYKINYTMQLNLKIKSYIEKKVNIQIPKHNMKLYNKHLVNMQQRKL